MKCQQNSLNFAATVKEKYPDALILGETWGDADRLVSGNRLDCAMNYLFKDAVTDWIAKDKISVSTFDQLHQSDALPLSARDEFADVQSAG